MLKLGVKRESNHEPKDGAFQKSCMKTVYDQV